MSFEVFDSNNTAVQMIIVLKLQKLQRDSIPSLTYQNLVSFLENGIWKDDKPNSLHLAANDVLSIEPAHIIRYMSKRAILDGAKSKLEDFNDVIGGK